MSLPEDEGEGGVHDRPVIEVRHKGLLTLAMMAAVLMQVLDQTIANVALPHMQASLGANQETVSWILTSYIVAAAMAIPATGWLKARFGVRKLLLASTFVFVAASALCGAAATLPEMVAFRILQGLGGACLSPLAQTLLFDINPRSQHPRALAIYGVGVMVGPVIGPILGGYLTDNVDWRWVFYINVPIGVFAFAGLWALLPRDRSVPTPFDRVGWMLIAVSIGAFQLMLDRGQHADWFQSNEIWLEAAIAAGAMWMFVIHLFTARDPLFAPAMLADRNLISGVVYIFIISLVMVSAMAVMPSMLQSLFGYSVTESGELIASRGIGMLISIALSARLMRMLDTRLILLFGLLIGTVSLWLMTGWSLDVDWHSFVLTGFIQGLGFGLVFTPVNILAFSTLPARYRANAASVFNLSRSIAGSIGIAVAMALLAHNTQVSHADLAANITPFSLAVDPSQLQSLGGVGDAALSIIDGMVMREALMIAYLDDFYFLMIAVLVTLPVLLLIRPVRTRPETGMTHVGME